MKFFLVFAFCASVFVLANGLPQSKGRTFFAKMNTDGNQYVTQGEMDNFATSFDMNNDGDVTVDEFIVQAKSLGLTDDEADALEDKINDNDDNFITQSEIESTFNKIDDQDSDDEQITWPEFSELWDDI